MTTTQPGHVDAPAALSRPRIVGVDAARGLAIIGMMAAHVWPRSPDGGELIVDGRPSVLFAVVAGVALGLVTGGPNSGAVRRGDARLSLSIRGGLLIALGLLLWMLPSGIAIILDYYGIMFLLLVPLLFLPRGWLAAIAVALLVAAPFARDSLVAAEPLQAEPWLTASDYLLLGYYPALLWLPLLVVGLLCARAGLGSTRVRLLMLGLGTLASIAGYGAAAVLPGQSATAHSGTVPELLGSGGLAVALIALALVILDSSRTPRLISAFASPLVAIGRVPLTVYTGHVIVIALLAPLGPAGQFGPELGIGLLIGFIAAAGVIGMVCLRLQRRGPLEALLSLIAGLPARRHREIAAVPQ